MKQSCENIFSYYCGSVIKKKRKEIGMTGSDLAKKLNISQQQISRYERGNCRLTMDMMFDVAMALGISFEKLIKCVIAELETSDSDDAVFLRKKIMASEPIHFY